MLVGFVFIYMILYRRMHDLENDHLEMIVQEIKKPNSIPFLFSAWYRPLKTPVENFEYFESFLEKADSKYSESYILGDLNCNFLSNPLERHTLCLLDVLINFQFKQLLNETTRTTTSSKTLIDLVITNSKESISHTGVYPLSKSDHDLIYAQRTTQVH